MFPPRWKIYKSWGPFWGQNMSTQGQFESQTKYIVKRKPRCSLKEKNITLLCRSNWYNDKMKKRMTKNYDLKMGRLSPYTKGHEKAMKRYSWLDREGGSMVSMSSNIKPDKKWNSKQRFWHETFECESVGETHMYVLDLKEHDASCFATRYESKA